MPKEEVYFEQQTNGRRIEVLKTYDHAFAREAFGNMDDNALGVLADALEIAANNDPADIPPRSSPEYGGFLWDEMQDAAREDGNQLSFFVVTEARAGKSESLFVSPDWPSAERFARSRIRPSSQIASSSPQPR